MMNPDKAWEAHGVPCWILAEPELVELEEKKSPYCMLPRSFRLGFKAGVKVADHCFFQKPAPEHRQN